MRTFLSAAFTLFLMALPARAGVFLEPDLGFEFGSSTQDFKYTNAPENKSDYSQNGLTYGVALGYRKTLLYGAAQYEKGMGSHISDITVLAGLYLGLSTRFWLGYIVSAKDEVSSGSGFKAGIGTSIGAFLCLNGEYDKRTYSTYQGVTASTLTYSGTTNSFKVTLSAPLHLF